MKKIITVILLSTLLGASCKKTNTPSPTDQLPPTTQTGANTFGCLVNGKVWIPKGYECNTKPNPSITYDFDFNGLPYLDIKTNHFVNCTPQGFMNISFSKLNHLGNFSFPSDFNFSTGWSEVINGCFTQAFDTTIRKIGGGVITKLDIPNRIISGTFNCKFKTLQCDTVFMTDGRFDVKF